MNEVLRDNSLPGLGWRDLRLVLLLMGICFLGHFNRISMAVAADLRIMEQYGLSTVQMGTVYSAFLFAYTAAMIPGGWLIDRLGPKFALAAMCLGSAAFMALTGSVGWVNQAASALLMLLVIRSLMGVLSVPLHPGAATAVAQNLPAERRSLANGWITGAALLGIATTFPLFGFLIDRFDWPASFAILGLATAGLGVLWLVYGPAWRPELVSSAASESEVESDRHRWTRRRNLLLLTLSYGAVGYFQYLFFYWVHHYLSEVLKVAPETSRGYAAIPTFAMAVGMPIGGWLSDRLFAAFGWRTARAGLAVSVMATSAVLLWIGAKTTEPTQSILWLSLSLGVLGMSEGLFWNTAVEVGGACGGLSAAIFNTGGNGIGLIAPMATPFISDELGYGWQAGITVASVVCLAGAACWIWITPPESIPST